MLNCRYQNFFFESEVDLNDKENGRLVFQIEIVAQGQKKRLGRLFLRSLDFVSVDAKSFSQRREIQKPFFHQFPIECQKQNQPFCRDPDVASTNASTFFFLNFGN